MRIENPLPMWITWNVTGTSSLSSPYIKQSGWTLLGIVTITPNGTHQSFETLSCYANSVIGVSATLDTRFTILSEYILLLELFQLS